MNHQDLVSQAASALLAQTDVTVTHPAGWERNGFPLPIKREAPNPDGSVTQRYRPMVIFEYVNDLLTVRKPKTQENPDTETLDLFGAASAPVEDDLFK